MSRNIRTFRDIGGSDGEDSGNDDPRRPTEHYVGSGQQVRAPVPTSSQGAFNRLAMQATANQDNAEDDGREVVEVNVTFWDNGFSVEDGPLRSPEDPDNAQLIQALMTGRIPDEFVRKYPGKNVDCKLHRENRDYQKSSAKPFQGSGARLGNAVPEIVSNNPTPQPEVSADEKVKNLEDAKKELNVDSNTPTTNIQIRLPNNERIVATFNQSHTIDSIRGFICTARPEVALQPFQLMTTYPSKVLEDETATLKDANLLSSVIAVKPQPV